MVCDYEVGLKLDIPDLLTVPALKTFHEDNLWLTLILLKLSGTLQQGEVVAV